MLKRRCPFVGLCGDPDTVVAFASTRNCCNRVEEPGPIRLAYQHSHCFKFDHRHCEVLLQENRLNELPPEIAAFPARKRAAIIVGGAASLVVTAIFLVIFFGWWQPAEAINQDKKVQVVPVEPTPTLLFEHIEPPPTEPAPLEPTNEQSIIVVAATDALVPTVTVTEQLPPTETVNIPTVTSVPPTAAPTTCGAPSGWGIYIVQVGDTLSSIAAAQGVTVSQLQNANCLATAAVYVGQRLYVPNPSPITPAPTWTAMVLTATAVFTNTPFPSNTPEPTLEPTTVPTQPPTLEPTATEIPQLPTDTPLPVVPTDTPVPLPTDPPAPTATPTPITLPATPTP